MSVGAAGDAGDAGVVVLVVALSVTVALVMVVGACGAAGPPVALLVVTYAAMIVVRVRTTWMSCWRSASIEFSFTLSSAFLSVYHIDLPLSIALLCATAYNALMTQSPKRIAVIGPTSSGKSAIAIDLAHHFAARFRGGAAVIGADSRQVYRFMDIGSGKEPGTLVTDPSLPPHLRTYYDCAGVRHYMIDIVAPRTPYGAGQFITRGQRILRALDDSDTLPIICGGTHFWVQTLLENTPLPPVAPNTALRRRLAHTSAAALMAHLRRMDPARARALNTPSERTNRRRLIRAIEIATARGSVPHITPAPPRTDTTLLLAVIPEQDVLRQRIATRLRARLRDGMLDEVQTLHTVHRVPWTRLEAFGLEYRWCARYLRGQCTMTQMRANLERDILRFAKRQLLWIRRWERAGAHIHHITTRTHARRYVRAFLAS